MFRREYTTRDGIEVESLKSKVESRKLRNGVTKSRGAGSVKSKVQSLKSKVRNYQIPNERQNASTLKLKVHKVHKVENPYSPETLLLSSAFATLCRTGFTSAFATLRRTGLSFPHTSFLTPHPSFLTPHSSHLTPHASPLTPHASLLIPHLSKLFLHQTMIMSLNQMTKTIIIFVLN